jgi:hypothetical protein
VLQRRQGESQFGRRQTNMRQVLIPFRCRDDAAGLRPRRPPRTTPGQAGDLSERAYRGHPTVSDRAPSAKHPGEVAESWGTKPGHRSHLRRTTPGQAGDLSERAYRGHPTVSDRASSTKHPDEVAESWGDEAWASLPPSANYGRASQWPFPATLQRTSDLIRPLSAGG